MNITKIENYNDIMKSYDPLKNVSKNILSKYEAVSIIGTRAEQLQRGAVPFVNFDKNNFNARDIARQELLERKIPFMICRTLTNGVKEYWRLDDLIY